MASMFPKQILMTCYLLLSLLPLNVSWAETGIRLHDAHVHYNEEMWNDLPPADAIKLLKEHNIQRALVSSTPTIGTEKLYKQDPKLVIPMLRPYKSKRHRYFWYRDPEILDYIESHLKRVPYKGIGEFHVFGIGADTPQMAQVIQLANNKKLALHAHTNLIGIRILLAKAKDIPVIWAHAGFDVDEDILIKLFEQYPNFYAELSLRENMLDEDGSLTTKWKKMLIKYRQYFILGMDTYTPDRWANLPELADDDRLWLKQLPKDVMIDIERDNIDRLFPK